MKYIKLLTIIATCVLVTSIFTVIPAFSAQPPITTGTYYVGTIGQPARLDPVRAYDTASAELIQNVYQPLIWFGDKNVLTLTSGAGYNMTQADHSDLTYPSGYTPVIATALPIITTFPTEAGGTGQIWNFTINTNAQFQNWTSPTAGALNDKPKRNVTVADVVYSFQYQMVFDSAYSPVWMWETAAFNIMTFDAIGAFPAVEATVGQMIQGWCKADPDHPSTNVIFNFTYPLPTSAMAQIFSQTWGSIVNKEFYIAHGAWDGSFAAGWAAAYRQMPNGDGNRTPIDRYYAAKSSYLAGGLVGIDVPDMCGTGPYKYEYGGWNQITSTWELFRDPTYWKGWGAAGDGAGNYISTIIEKGIDTWPTRKMLFLDGEFDTAVVPRANMFDLLVNKYQPLAGLTLVTNITGLVNEEVFFTFNVTGDSSYQSYVGYPTHLVTEPYFFNNTNIRLAFAYALNYTQIIDQGWFGEAVQQASWWVDGLVPASSKNVTLSSPANMRNIDIAKIRYYLSQAIIDGYNISQKGFETTAIYNTGNDQRQIELQSIANAFAVAGPNYRINIVGLDWPVFLDNMYAYSMPVYCIGWLADYADPSDWASPYQQSTGAFLFFQGPPFPADQAAIDAQITAAATEANPVTRDLDYQKLQYEYSQDLPSVPVVQPVGRRFARDWVKGWYYNDLFPGLYFYDLYKAPAVGSATNIDMDVQDTVAPLTTYPVVFISKGKMKIPFGGGVLASMTFNVTMKRNDAAGIVPAIISLVRDNLTALSDYRTHPSHDYSLIGIPVPSKGWVWIPGRTLYEALPAQSPVDPTQVIVATNGGSSTSVTLTWYEDGVVSTLPANATWSMGALVGIPSTAGPLYNDTNLGNNAVTMSPSIYNCTAKTATTEVLHGSTTYEVYFLYTGDINGDGRVDILDAIALSNVFLKQMGQVGFNADADINQDGVVNILDAILLANNFNKQLSFITDP